MLEHGILAVALCDTFAKYLMTIAAGLWYFAGFNQFIGAVVADVFVEFVVKAVVIFAVVDAITAILAMMLTIAISIDVLSTRAAIVAE